MHADITKIAKLARISIDEGEASGLGQDLDRILTWIEQLKEVDTSSVQGITHPTGQTRILREDAVHMTNTPEEVLANSPLSKAQMFCVPKMIE